MLLLSALRIIAVAATFLSQPQPALGLLTPVGHAPSGKPIYVVPNKSRVRQVGRELKVFDAKGALIHTFTQKSRSVQRETVGSHTHTRTRRQGITTVAASVPLTNTNSSKLEAFNTTFVVRPAPKKFDSQLLWIANSLVATDEHGVPYGELSTVIQYGATSLIGGSYWTVLAQFEWFPDAGAILIAGRNGVDPTISPGTVLNSSIIHDPTLGNPGETWYMASFSGRDDLPQLGSLYDTPGMVARVGMEEEGVVEREHYPDAESVRFTKTNLLVTEGYPEVKWDSAVEGEGGSDGATGAYVTVDVDGAEGTEITLHFGN
ncbi:hypothetical protein R3P38DRAFT_2866238 [Favolaschia claudopus]|uniref:Uncharacterized protein n=1 Tax=Favolaschia claudopus TaxID=2862362 RepID=A0AAW0DHN6_9AGAR